MYLEFEEKGDSSKGTSENKNFEKKNGSVLEETDVNDDKVLKLADTTPSKKLGIKSLLFN